MWSFCKEPLLLINVEKNAMINSDESCYNNYLLRRKLIYGRDAFFARGAEAHKVSILSTLYEHPFCTKVFCAAFL